MFRSDIDDPPTGVICDIIGVFLVISTGLTDYFEVVVAIAWSFARFIRSRWWRNSAPDSISTPTTSLPSQTATAASGLSFRSTPTRVTSSIAYGI